MSIPLTADTRVEIAGNGGETLDFAREDLARYLARMLGPARGGAAGPRVALALAPDPDLGDEGYEIGAASGGVGIRGGGPAGVVFGVYEFLRRFGGCQFSGLGPDGEHVPRRAELAVPEGRLRWRPALWYRGLQFTRSETDARRIEERIDWMAKNGMNYVMIHPRPDAGGAAATALDPATGQRMDVESQDDYDEAFTRRVFLPAIRRRGLKLDMNHHNLCFWLPPGRYFAEHPEWYALTDGARRAARSQLCLCTSNPEAVAALIENVKAYLRRTPEARIVGIIPEDGVGMCQCEACRRLDADPGDAFRKFRGHRSRDGMNPSKSRRYARLLNAVARALREEFPGVLVGAAAYVDLQWPPEGEVLEPTIVPWVAIYWRCAAHPLAPDACAMNRLFDEVLESWKRAHRGPLIVYEYYMGMGAQKSMPYPMAEVIIRDWPRLKALGIGGATIQSRGPSHNTYALNYLAFARCAWETAADAGQVRDEFLLGMFGAAAPALKPIYERFAERWAAAAAGAASPYLKPVPPAVGCVLPNSRNVAFLLDDATERLLDDCLARAAALPLDDRERRQVAAFRAAAGYWRFGKRLVQRDAARAPGAPLAPPETLRTLRAELDRLETEVPYGWGGGFEGWRKLLA